MDFLLNNISLEDVFFYNNTHNKTYNFVDAATFVYLIIYFC